MSKQHQVLSEARVLLSIEVGQSELAQEVKDAIASAIWCIRNGRPDWAALWIEAARVTVRLDERMRRENRDVE